MKIDNNNSLVGQMHKLIPEAQIGDFKIEYKIATEEDVKFEKMRSAIHNDYNGYGFHDFVAGTYTTLKYFGNIIMSDTPMEIRTCQEAVENAHGNVLIAGLGLGIVLLEIQAREPAKSITVIEKNKEVLKLVKRYLPINKTIEIIKDDIFKWLPNKNTKFDTIYFDIWSDICSDNYVQMKELHKKFRKYLKKDGWMGSWSKDFCKEKYFEDR
jgi:hypothetical protein